MIRCVLTIYSLSFTVTMHFHVYFMTCFRFPVSNIVSIVKVCNIGPTVTLIGYLGLWPNRQNFRVI